MQKLLTVTLLIFGLSMIFVLTTSQAFAGTWKKPACALAGYSLEKRSNKNQWRCKKYKKDVYQYRAKGTSSARGQCKSVAGIGYHWAKRSNIWKCCGTSPLGETCKSFTSKVAGINVGVCPSGFSKRNTGDSKKVCRKSVKSYFYKSPMWVD